MTETWLIALAGGILIGLSAGGMYFVAGEIAGIAGLVRRSMTGPDRGWRLAFLAGMAVAALIWIETGQRAQALAGLAPQSPLWLATAGLLVGVGTALGNGCTSGHGVCGLSRFSRRSLVAVCVFMITAAATVWLRRQVGL